MIYWEKLNYYRVLKGYSWYKVAQLSGVKENTITTSRKRNKCLSFEKTCLIANVLDIDLNELNTWRD